jgi:hypothetical protein
MGRRAVLAGIIVAAAALPAVATGAGTIERLPKRDYGLVTAKLTGVPGASVTFYALTKKLLSKHGRPINVTWYGLAGVPISCTQGTIEMGNGGSFYTGTSNPATVSAGGAFTFQVLLSAYGYTGITMTVAGQYADHYKQVSGTVSLTEDPSPETIPDGAGPSYTNCTVASTPYAFSAKPKWRSEEY